MDKKRGKKSKLPEWKAGIVLYFPKRTTSDEIRAVLGDYLSEREFDEPCSPPDYTKEVTYCETSYCYSWEVDDVLTALFRLCNAKAIDSAIKQFNARVLIDIVCYSFEGSPAFIFTGDNMRLIREFQANISIDLY